MIHKYTYAHIDNCTGNPYTQIRVLVKPSTLHRLKFVKGKHPFSNSAHQLNRQFAPQILFVVFCIKKCGGRWFGDSNLQFPEADRRQIYDKYSLDVPTVCTLIKNKHCGIYFSYIIRQKFLLIQGNLWCSFIYRKFFLDTLKFAFLFLRVYRIHNLYPRQWRYVQLVHTV